MPQIRPIFDLGDLFKNEVYFKLKEAELEAKSTDKRYTHEEIFSSIKSELKLNLFKESSNHERH